MVGNKNPLPTLQERLFFAPVFARFVSRNFLSELRCATLNVKRIIYFLDMFYKARSGYLICLPANKTITY